MRHSKSLVAALAAYALILTTALVPTTAYATSVDLHEKYDQYQGSDWNWCGAHAPNGDCTTTIFFSAENLNAGGLTYSHTTIGAGSQCPFTMVAAARMTSEHGWVSAVGWGTKTGYTNVAGGTLNGYQLDQRVLYGGGEVYYAVQIGFPGSHTKDYWIANCSIWIETLPSSTDSDMYSTGPEGHQNYIWGGIQP